jgi:hypothetical protein
LPELDETVEETVKVPESTFQLSSDNQKLLVTTINPLCHSEKCGIDIYLRTVAFLINLPTAMSS